MPLCQGRSLLSLVHPQPDGEVRFSRPAPSAWDAGAGAVPPFGLVVQGATVQACAVAAEHSRLGHSSIQAECCISAVRDSSPRPPTLPSHFTTLIGMMDSLYPFVLIPQGVTVNPN